MTTTSKLIIDIGAQHKLSAFHKHESFNFRYFVRDQSFTPPNGISIRPRIEVGKLYFMGSGGPFNYKAAISYIKRALLIAASAPHFLSSTYKTADKTHENVLKPFMYSDESEFQNDINLWNGEAINRIEMLKSARFDSLLNCLRADVLKTIDPESQALTHLFDTLWQAAFDFVTKKNPCLATAKQEFGRTAIAAIGNAHKCLVTDTCTTLLTELLGAIVSICTLGIVNYATGRSMYGLFSSRIDVSVKLGHFTSLLGNHTP